VVSKNKHPFSTFRKVSHCRIVVSYKQSLSTTLFYLSAIIFPSSDLAPGTTPPVSWEIQPYARSTFFANYPDKSLFSGLLSRQKLVLEKAHLRPHSCQGTRRRSAEVS
jgi:hypothetical protein